MHASIKFSPSVADTLNYHEQKISQRVAECIGAENYAKDHQVLSYADKLYPLQLRAGYNDSVQNKIFHTALQFGPSVEISNATMAAVAREYMQEMGYGDQPYLIYRHRDAAQAHVHVVAANVDREGHRIGVSKYALLRSFSVAEQLTQKYGLESRQKVAATIPQALEQVHKGLQYLYPVMNRIVEEVVPHYRYTSLEELNAVLRLHQVEASRGKSHTITYQKQGLHYHPLKADGQPAREYLPARRFPSRPTLGQLEKRFAENLRLRERHREPLTVLVDYTLAGKTLSLEAMKQALAKRKVSVVMGEDKGAGQSIWYIDHQSKAVFEGAALGASYSFGAMQKRLVSEETYQTLQESQRHSHNLRHSL